MVAIGGDGRVEEPLPTPSYHRAMRLATRMAAVVVALAAVLGACVWTDPAGTNRVATKQQDGGLRTDPAPLTKRFAALGTPVDVRWASGTMSDGGAPGPTTYWIDAVVTLSPAVASGLRPYAGSAPSAPPSLVGVVAQSLPTGALRTSAELDARLAAPNWQVHGYLVEGTDVLILTGVGDR